MNRTLCGLLCVVIPALSPAQTLAVKLGAWEMTIQGAALRKPMVDKECVTKADLAELTKGPDKDDDEACKLVKAPTISGNKWTADRTCPDGRTVHAEFIAASAEKVTGTIVSNAPKGGPSMRMEVSGRWLGPSCAGIP